MDVFAKPSDFMASSAFPLVEGYKNHDEDFAPIEEIKWKSLQLPSFKSFAEFTT